MSGREFRVMWRREGREVQAKILQTSKAARAKVERLKRIDAELAETPDGQHQPDPFGGGAYQHPLQGMPPLVEEPVIQERSVGEWRSSEPQ